MDTPSKWPNEMMESSTPSPLFIQEEKKSKVSLLEWDHADGELPPTNYTHLPVPTASAVSSASVTTLLTDISRAISDLKCSLTEIGHCVSATGVAVSAIQTDMNGLKNTVSRMESEFLGLSNLLSAPSARTDIIQSHLCAQRNVTQRKRRSRI